MKFRRRSNLFSCVAIVGHKVKELFRSLKVSDQIGERVFFHDDVWGDTAPVTDETSVGGAKNFAERVGKVARLSVGTAIFEVIGLNATPRRDVIFGRGQLHHAAIREVFGRLHQSFSIGASSHNYCAVVILQTARRDLGRGGRGIIHQDGKRHPGVEGGSRGLVGFVHVGVFSACTQHFLPLRNEEVDHLNGLSHEAAAVVAEVEHHAFRPLFAKLVERIVEVFRGVFGESAQQDVANLVGKERGVNHRRLFNGLARDAEAQQTFASRSLHRHGERRSGIAAQQVGDFLTILPAFRLAAHAHILVVDAHNDVARADARQPSGHVQIRRVEGTAIAGLVIANGRTDAGVLAGRHQTQLVSSSGFVELGVRVETIQHVIDGPFHLLFRVQRVDIVEVEIAIEGVENIQRLRCAEIMGFLRLLCCQLCGAAHEEQ